LLPGIAAKCETASPELRQARVNEGDGNAFDNRSRER